jgi:magnesium transporter
MNFETMPELKWLHGYSFVFGLTAFTTLVTWWYVKKRKWF